MRIIIRLVILIPLVANQVFGQINFKTAKEESGIIYSGFRGLNLGYDISSTEARFSYSGFIDSISIYLRFKDGTQKRLEDDYQISAEEKLNLRDSVVIYRARVSNYKVAVPISDGTNTLYSGGAFAPGLTLQYEYSKHQSSNIKPKDTYWFIRPGYELKQNKFGYILPNDSIKIKNELSHAFGVTLGVNWLLSGKKKQDNAILAFSVAFKYNIKSVDGLKTKEFALIDTTVSNGSRQKIEKAYDKTLGDYLSVMPKVDFVWTPWIFTDEDGIEYGSRVGMLGSLSVKYNARNGKIAGNFGFGPSIHPKFYSSQIIAALQAEFIDFTNSTGDKKFNDIFGISLYIGIPLQLKKS